MDVLRICLIRRKPHDFPELKRKDPDIAQVIYLRKYRGFSQPTRTLTIYFRMLIF